MDPKRLSAELDRFLGGSRDAAVLEDGLLLFDLRSARYSIAGEHGKCLLHLWSHERNAVRRVLDCQGTRGKLKLSVQRFGQSKPGRMEIVLGNGASRTALAAARATYEARLQQALAHAFPPFTADRLRSTADLEHSLSPVYARGVLRAGRTAHAVLGVNAAETQAAMDGALTFGLLWMDHCRRNLANRAHVEGLRLIAPAGATEVLRERMAHLDHQAAKFELYEFNERETSLNAVDCSDRGNISTRLLRAVNEPAVRQSFRAAIEQVRELAARVNAAGELDCIVTPSGEISFRVHGLEFAQARWPADAPSFSSQAEVVFGLGAAQHVLSNEIYGPLVELLAAIVDQRRTGGDHASPLWRSQPERWLESLVLRNLSALDSCLPSANDSSARVYSQVPAFSRRDRAMIDVLALTSDSRLAVIELKADEDLHLPMQGLDYWARVNWHHQRGEFQRFGYFPGATLSPALPRLLLVAPALRIHPATDTLLRYFSPEIEWTLAGIDERWREGVRVVFRKHRSQGVSA